MLLLPLIVVVEELANVVAVAKFVVATADEAAPTLGAGFGRADEFDEAEKLPNWVWLLLTFADSLDEVLVLVGSIGGIAIVLETRYALF